MKTLLKKIFGNLFKQWETKKIVDELYEQVYIKNDMFIKSVRSIGMSALTTHRKFNIIDEENPPQDPPYPIGIWLTQLDVLFMNKVRYLVKLLNNNSEYKSILENWINNSVMVKYSDYWVNLDFYFCTDIVAFQYPIDASTAGTYSSVNGTTNRSLTYIIKNLKNSLES